MFAEISNLVARCYYSMKNIQELSLLYLSIELLI